MKLVRTFTLAVVLALFATSAAYAKGEKPPKPEKPDQSESSQNGNGNKPEKYEYEGTYFYWDGAVYTESGRYQTHSVLTGNGLLRFQYQSKYESVYTDPWGFVFESNSNSHYRSVTKDGYFLDYSSHGWNRYENAYADGVYRYQCTPEGCMVTITENGDKTRYNY